MRKVRAGTRGLPGWAPNCKSRPRVPPLPALSAQALPSPSSISAPPPKGTQQSLPSRPKLVPFSLPRMPSPRHRPGSSS